MDLVKGAVSDQIMGQIGGLLGTDAKKTPSIFETAAGSILGGLIKKGSTPQGAQDIFGAVEQQDDSILDKLGDLLGGGDATDDFQKQGTGILDMVLGGSEQTNGMIGTIAKALGLDDGIIGKLLMMAAPIIMGVIGKHIKNKALDAVGLGDLLGTQKQHLASFMPSSLTNDLGFGDLLGEAGGAVNAVGDAAKDVGNAAGRMAGDAADAASSAGGSLLKYIIPVGLLALLAVAGYPWIMNMVSKMGHEGVESAASVGETVKGLDFSSLPGFDELGETGTKMSEGFQDITSGLEGVTDESGAKTLAEKITGFTGAIDGFGLDKLDGTAKTAASGMIGKFIDAVKDMIGGKSEGIQGILKPVIDLLMEKLSPFK
jgi:hypothetical protein